MCLSIGNNRDAAPAVAKARSADTSTIAAVVALAVEMHSTFSGGQRTCGDAAWRPQQSAISAIRALRSEISPSQAYWAGSRHAAARRCDCRNSAITAIRSQRSEIRTIAGPSGGKRPDGSAARQLRQPEKAAIHAECSEIPVVTDRRRLLIPRRLMQTPSDLW